jgi:hypothetical protein
MLLPQAKADEYNQKTTFTFSGPVEIPGQVLPAGTYVFRLDNSSSDRNIVRVYNKDENHLYGTFLAIPDYRLKQAEKPIITFHERAAGEPIAIKGWVYPGKNYGREFVYPKSEAVALAKANKEPVPAMPTELAANTTKPAPTLKEPEIVQIQQAPLKAERPQAAAPANAQPEIEEVEIAQAFTPPPPQEQAAKLPATASSYPLIFLIALTALGMGELIRRLAGTASHGR